MNIAQENTIEEIMGLIRHASRFPENTGKMIEHAYIKCEYLASISELKATRQAYQLTQKDK